MKVGKVMKSLVLIAAVTAIGACGRNQLGVDDPGETGESQFALAPGSCPVTTEIVSLELTSMHQYTKRLWTVSVSRLEIDAHCAGTTSTLAQMNLRPGSYESVAEAKDANGAVINDVNASFSTWTIRKGQTTAINATVKAATGTGTASGSFAIDNASFDNDGSTLTAGCCTPKDGVCNLESVVGCKRATNSGLCTGWTTDLTKC